MEKAAKTVLPARAAELIDTGVFQQLAGVNPTSFTMNGTTFDTAARKLHVQGHNSIVCHFFAHRTCGSAATDQALTSADKMTLQLIDYIMELNAVSEQPIEPLNNGEYDLYLHPYQIVDLRLDATPQFNGILLSLQG